RHHDDAHDGARAGAARHSRECDRAGNDRYGAAARRQHRGRAGRDGQDDSARPHRAARRYRERRGVPGLRRVSQHDGPDAACLRRSVDAIAVPPRTSLVAAVLVASLLIYAVVAVTRHWWPSAVMAPLLAMLLWQRHGRARFAAYVFFSVMAVRGLV